MVLFVSLIIFYNSNVELRFTFIQMLSDLSYRFLAPTVVGGFGIAVLVHLELCEEVFAVTVVFMASIGIIALGGFIIGVCASKGCEDGIGDFFNNFPLGELSELESDFF